MIHDLVDIVEKARRLHGRRRVHGLGVSVENEKGTVRPWRDETGREGSTIMSHPYGYIRGTDGKDGDHVDCYVGPDPDSPCVFVVNQMAKPDYSAFDEHKVMLGFRTRAEAVAAYCANRDDGASAMGSIVEMTVEEFRAWLACGMPEVGPAGLVAQGSAGYHPDLREVVALEGAPATAPAGPSQRLVVKAAAGAVLPGHKYVKRERRGDRWVYTYPDEGESHTPPFDTDPLRWEPKHAPGALPVGWVAGGVDPRSDAPVKEAGVREVLYQIADPEPEPGWALLRDLRTGKTKKVQHDRVLAVRPVAERRPAPTIPTSTPTKPPPRLVVPRDPGGEKAPRLPPWPQSGAKPGSAVHKMESGVFPMKVVRERRVVDVDTGKTEVVRERRAAVDDATRQQLLAELAPMIDSAARRAQRLFGLRDAWLLDPSRPRVNLTLVELRAAAMEGVLRAIESYPGGRSFLRHATFFARDHARLQAARERAGGLAMPARHFRVLGGYVAARAEARRVLGVDEPTPEQVAEHWRLRKRDLHDGLGRSPQGSEGVPLGSYRLKAVRLEGGGHGLEDVLEQPGKLDWARRMDAFLRGDRGAGQDPGDGGALFPSATVGVGLSVEDKLVIRTAMAEVLGRLRRVPLTLGETRKRIRYTADAGRMLELALGLAGDGEQRSTAQIAAEVPISREVAGEMKPLGERQARAIVPKFLEHAFGVARRLLGPDAGRLVSQAQERLLPAEVAPSGPTFGEILHRRARAVTAEQVEAWRRDEGERLRSIASKMASRIAAERAAGTLSEPDLGHRQSLVAKVEEAAARVPHVPEDEVRMRVARRLAPESAEMRRLATQTVAIEADSPGYEYGYAVAVMTDPSTGKQRRVRVRTFRDLRDPEDRETMLPGGYLAKSVTAQMYGEFAQWPLLTSLLWASDDEVADAPTADRAAVERMLWLGGGERA